MAADIDSIVTRAKSRELAGENPYRVYIDAKNAAEGYMTPDEYESFIRRLCETLEI